MPSSCTGADDALITERYALAGVGRLQNVNAQRDICRPQHLHNHASGTVWPDLMLGCRVYACCFTLVLHELQDLDMTMHPGSEP